MILFFEEFFPSFSEFSSAIPVILSLIFIEGLLSVDNAMAIAAMASELPKKEQILALRLGIIGAYVFRGVSIFFVAFIIENIWLKILGSAYLLYLMTHGLHIGETKKEILAKPIHHTLFVTILQIEIMDLSLSLDNVVAAVALDKRIWVVCTGVFIGILALRFVAGYCIKLIEKFPILQKTAYLLIGFVGFILLFELMTQLLDYPIYVHSFQKFIGVFLITGLTIAYDHTKIGRTVLKPVVKIGKPILGFIHTLFVYVCKPFSFVFKILQRFYIQNFKHSYSE